MQAAKKGTRALRPLFFALQISVFFVKRAGGESKADAGDFIDKQWGRWGE